MNVTKAVYFLLRVSGFKKKKYIYCISANISEYRIFKSPNICIGIGLKNPFIGRALVNICQALMHLVL